MTEIISFAEYKAKLELRQAKNELIKKMNTKMEREEIDLTLLQLLDLFCSKHQPDIYWGFELFINGKLD